MIISRHSVQLENDFSNFISIICQNRDVAINFFVEHIGFVIPRLKDLLVHVTVASKADIEFHMNNRPLRLFGEVQTEIYLEQFCKWLAILFECGQRDIGTSSVLVIHAYEIIEHLLANLDECLLAKVIIYIFEFEVFIGFVLVFKSCIRKSYYLVNSRKKSNFTTIVSVCI